MENKTKWLPHFSPVYVLLPFTYIIIIVRLSLICLV